MTTQERLPAVSGLPEPTTDPAQAATDLQAHGICLVADALTPGQLADAHDAVYRAADSDRARGRVQSFGLDYPDDDTNQRVWNLPSRDPIFCDLSEHPTALGLVRAAIGWPALLSNISANITGPGGGEMVLHADQLYMPQPWAGLQGVNVVWFLDDFTEDNGATRVVPGSHRLNRTPEADDQDVDTVPLQGPAGTMAVVDGRVWHKTGRNRTIDQRRAGAFGWYTTPIYRPQENWFLALDPSVRQFGSDELLTLLGYKAEGLGLVNGSSPD